MDEFKIDFKSLFNTKLMSDLSASDDPKHKEMHAMLRVFERHGIGAIEAIEILLEVVSVIENK